MFGGRREAAEGAGEELTENRNTVKSVCALSDDGLVLGSNNSTIRTWGLNKGGECLQTLPGHTSGVSSVCALSGGPLKNNTSVGVLDREVPAISFLVRLKRSVCALVLWHRALVTRPFACGISAGKESAD